MLQNILVKGSKTDQGLGSNYVNDENIVYQPFLNPVHVSHDFKLQISTFNSHSALITQHLRHLPIDYKAHLHVLENGWYPCNLDLTPLGTTGW